MEPVGKDDLTVKLFVHSTPRRIDIGQDSGQPGGGHLGNMQETLNVAAECREGLDGDGAGKRRGGANEAQRRAN